jgi:adenine-specific DNA-methyltransferase
MTKRDDALQILGALGLPPAHQNERSALTLLALVQLREHGSWQQLQAPLLGVKAILDFCRESYGKPYAEGSRGGLRKHALQPFVDAGLALQNPDAPRRAASSAKSCYQITPEALDLLGRFRTPGWAAALAAERKFSPVPCPLDDGSELLLAPGPHSELIRAAIQEFTPRFAPGAKLLYLGDTGNEHLLNRAADLAALGVTLRGRGKLPDLVLYQADKGWLILVECVTSVGPVDDKRHAELTALFQGSTAGLVFVTAFPNRTLMARFLADIAWETEVWCADSATHLIHLNGDRFLGPH